MISIIRSSRYFIHPSKRLFCSIGNSTQQMTRESVQNGWKIIEKVNIVRNWNKMSTKTKICISSYTTIVFANLSYLTYNDGKKALLDIRNTKTFSSPEEQQKLEWEAVRGGCSNELASKFFNSLLFPITITSNIFPSIVLALNPPPKKE